MPCQGPWTDLDAGEGLVGLGAGGSQDAAGRAALALVPKPHAPLLRLLHDLQLRLLQEAVQELRVRPLWLARSAHHGRVPPPAPPAPPGLPLVAPQVRERHGHAAAVDIELGLGQRHLWKGGHTGVLYHSGFCPY